MGGELPDPLPAPILDRLQAFIDAERKQFSGDLDTNLFGHRWGIVLGYRKYLSMVLADHKAAGSVWLSRHNTYLEHMRQAGSGKLDAERMEEMRQVGALAERVQLSIETFHLFASILLDRTAMAIHDSLLPARGVSLASHSKLQRQLPSFAEAHGIQLPSELAELAVSLEETEVAYRDERVAHLTQPRAMKGLSWRGSRGFRISAGILFPKPDEDAPSESTDPSEAIDRIDRYLDLVLLLMEENRALYRHSRAAGEAEIATGTRWGFPR